MIITVYFSPAFKNTISKSWDGSYYLETNDSGLPTGENELTKFGNSLMLAGRKLDLPAKGKFYAQAFTEAKEHIRIRSL